MRPGRIHRAGGDGEEAVLGSCSVRVVSFNVRGAVRRMEECFAEAKREVGMDQYEVRRWEA